MKMKLNVMNRIVVLLFLLTLSAYSLAAKAASVGTNGINTAFSKGSTTLGLAAGSGSQGNENYFILGVGVGYYLLEGLEIGIDIQHWFSGSPSISKISPQVRYIFTQQKQLKPYIGVFARRTYIENQEDNNSFGYRAGAYFSANNGVYMGGGIVYEEYTDCARFIECSNTYPEIIITISF